MFGRVNNAGAPAPGGPPPQPNWLQEWSSRTPLLCRVIIYATTLTGLLSWALTLAPYLQLMPYLVMTRGEVWRLLSGIVLQGGFIGLFFVVFTSATQLPPFELKRGTLPFLIHLFVNALIINILYAALGMALGLVVTPAFAVIPGQGLWPVLLMVIAEDKLLDPTGETPFLCIKLNNRMYPWFLALVFSLISFFPLLDLFLGCALAHAREFCAWAHAHPFPLSAHPHFTLSPFILCRPCQLTQVAHSHSSASGNLGDQPLLPHCALGYGARPGIRVRPHHHHPRWTK